MKKIIIIVSAVLVFFALVYTGLWFYQANKFKKDISNLSVENGHSVSVGEVQVSGFPFAKNVSIKDLKLSSSEGQNITFKDLQIEAGVFDSESVMTVNGQIVFHDAQNKGFVMELNPGSKSTIFAKEGKVYKIRSEGSGYKILNEADNNIVYVVSAQNIESEITFDGSIKYENKANAVKITKADGSTFSEADSVVFNLDFTDSPDKKLVKFDISLNNFITNYDRLNKVVVNVTELGESDQNSSNKHSFALKGDISFVSNNGNALAQGKASDLKLSFKNFVSTTVITLNLQNLEFASQNYKLSASGLVTSDPAVQFPFGDLNIKIDNFDNLVAVFDKKTQNQPSQGDSNYLTITEIVKNLGVINPESKDSTLVFNVAREKNMSSQVTLNDVPFVFIMSEAMKSSPKYRESLDNRPQPNLDKINLDDFSSVHLDISKMDPNLDPAKAKQFYNMLKTAKAIKMMKDAIGNQTAVLQ